MLSLLPTVADIREWLAEYVGQSRTSRVEIAGRNPGTAVEAMLGRFPQCRGNIEALCILLDAVDGLAETGVIKKPKGKQFYDRMYPRAPLPLYVTRVTEKKVFAEEERITWHPMLQGAGSLKGRQVETAKALNRYLLGKPDGLLDVIPVKERSLMIFGADKALGDDIVLTIAGRVIRASDFGARRVEPHLYHETFEGAASTAQGLIVENPTTFDTLAEWNRRTMTHPVMVLGEGTRITGSPNRLAEIARKTGVSDWLYFGDIDCEGLRIGWALASQMVGMGIRIRPHQGAYAWLAKHGRMVPPAYVTKGEMDVSRWPAIRAVVAAWLGDDQVLAVADATVEAVSLIPQEWMGMDVVAEAAEIGLGLPCPPVVPLLLESGAQKAT